MSEYTVDILDIGAANHTRVGGKAAGFRTLSRAALEHPQGFAITTDAFLLFLEENGLMPSLERAAKTKGDDGDGPLRDLQSAILSAPLPQVLQREIDLRLAALSSPRLAVRSSCNFEDTGDLSFAGVYDSFLNTPSEQVAEAVVRCYASLFSPRSVSYLQHNGIAVSKAAMGVMVQTLLYPKASGTVLTADSATGFAGNCVIEGWWGYGQAVVSGEVVPDNWRVYKSSGNIIGRKKGSSEFYYVAKQDGHGLETQPLSDSQRGKFCLEPADVELIARAAIALERLSGGAIDAEWAKCDDGTIRFLQCRPLKVTSSFHFDRCVLEGAPEEAPLVSGFPITDAIVTGSVKRISRRGDPYGENDILVLKGASTDWIPYLRQARGVVMESGGWTSHVAIILRELKIPALFGATDACNILEDGRPITLCCGKNPGVVWDGAKRFRRETIDLRTLPTPETKVHLVLSDTTNLDHYFRLPIAGIGLVRLEFLITQHVRIHPLALLDFDAGRRLDDATASQTEELTSGYSSKKEFYISTLTSAICEFASRCPDKIVNVRVPDFLSDDYLALVAGEKYEPVGEPNPMMGWRGTTRLIDGAYAEAFKMDCEAFRRCVDDLGFDNVRMLVPFCRTPADGEAIRKTISLYGPRRIDVGVMVELPSNIMLADEFSKVFDFFLVGPMDLTQLTYGCDRNSSLLGRYNNETEAVKRMVQHLLRVLTGHRKEIFIGGWPLFRHFPEYEPALSNNTLKLVELPDRFVELLQNLEEMERLKRRCA